MAKKESEFDRVVSGLKRFGVRTKEEYKKLKPTIDKIMDSDVVNIAMGSTVGGYARIKNIAGKAKGTVKLIDRGSKIFKEKVTDRKTIDSARTQMLKMGRGGEYAGEELTKMGKKIGKRIGDQGGSASKENIVKRAKWNKEAIRKK